jgi:hypothetical protein
VRHLVIACMWIVIGCAGSSSAPTVPPDVPPLPPPSPTAIGLLRGHDVELGLSLEQMNALRELDDSLQVLNHGLERELRALLQPDLPKPREGGRAGGPGGPGGPPGGGGMGGGPPMGGGGMGGGPPMGGGGMGGGGRGGGPPRGGNGGGEGQPPPRRDPPPLTPEQRERAKRIREEMDENERSFLQQALQALDDAQRAKALELLDGRNTSTRSRQPPETFR